MIRTALFFAFTSLVFLSPALAAEEPKPGTPEANTENSMKEEAEKNAEDYQLAAAKAYESLKSLTEGLKPEDAKHFYFMYNNHNLIGTVKMVQKDVGKAVDACGSENPDLKEPLQTR
jgi:hypothetical protein